MPKEFLYGSDKRVPGFGLILASPSAEFPEKKWVSENSVYTRIGSREESPISLAYSLVGNNAFLTCSMASIDYSGRPSFLAHHLELSPEEMLLYEDGPAYIIGSYQFEVQSSNEVGIEKNTRQFLHRFDGFREGNSFCGHWQNILAPYGINGRTFAGAVAVLILRGCKIHIVYSQNQKGQIFPLFQEVWSLLPANCRWKYTFNTYLSNIGTQYSLNGILKESEITASLSQMKQAYYIDLTSGTHNFPTELLECTNITGIEQYLITGNITESQYQYNQIPEFPTQSSDIWEEETALIQNLQEQLQKVKEELTIETTRANSELASLKEINSRYKNNSERLKNELNTMEAKIKEDEEKLSNQQKTKERLEDEISRLSQNLQLLKKQNLELSEKNTELVNQNQSFENKNNTLLGEITSNKYQFENILNTYNQYLQEKESLEKQLEKLGPALQNMRNEVAELNSEKSTLEHDLDVLRNCSKKKSLQKNIEKIHSFCEEVLSQIQSLDQYNK